MHHASQYSLIKGFIPIDDQMRVKNGDDIIPNIWAVGDVTGKLMLAHTAAAQGTIAVDNFCGGNVEINYKSTLRCSCMGKH